MQDGLVITWVVEWELAVVCVCVFRPLVATLVCRLLRYIKILALSKINELMSLCLQSGQFPLVPNLQYTVLPVY